MGGVPDVLLFRIHSLRIIMSARTKTTPRYDLPVPGLDCDTKDNRHGKKTVIYIVFMLGSYLRALSKMHGIPQRV